MNVARVIVDVRLPSTVCPAEPGLARNADDRDRARPHQPSPTAAAPLALRRVCISDVPRSVVISRCKCSISGAPIRQQVVRAEAGRAKLWLCVTPAIVGYAETKIVEKSDRDIWEIGRGNSRNAARQNRLREGRDRRADPVVIDDRRRQSRSGRRRPPINSRSNSISARPSTSAAARRPARWRAPPRRSTPGLQRRCSVSMPTPRRRRTTAVSARFDGEWTAPLGYLGPPAAFGLLSKRYEHQFGLDYAMLGKLAVAQRSHALLNDNACEKLRKPITVDDYLNSRMIADPIRLLDSVMVCDGAQRPPGDQRASAPSRRASSKFVVPIGYGERTNYPRRREHRRRHRNRPLGRRQARLRGGRAHAERYRLVPSLRRFHHRDHAAARNARLLQARPGLRLHQGDTISPTPATCRSTPAADRFRPGRPGSPAAAPTSIEAVRQLFGEGGKRQVKNTKNALVTGIGGIPYGRNWGTSVVMILTPGCVRQR